MIKYCLSSLQSPELLSKVQEIKVQSKDIKQIYDLLDQYPQAQIVYNLADPKGNEKTLTELAILSKNKRLTLALFSFDYISIAQELSLPYYFVRPVKTLMEAKAYKELGSNQLMPDAPLTHQLSQLKLINIPIRYNPTFSYLDGIPREEGVCGNWVLPQSLPDYELYISTIDFGSQPLKREETLYKLYTNQYYGGDLGKLIPDLQYLGSADLLQTEYLTKRIDCNMRCAQSGRPCHLCYNLLDLQTKLENANYVRNSKLKK